MLIYIPSAFTPNGDGINDEFKISFRDSKSFSIPIYNCFAQNIFRAILLMENGKGMIVLEESIVTS